jgi:pyruvate ferredoxin oxidoreductase alpha subunit
MPVEIPDQAEVDKFLPPYKHDLYCFRAYRGKSPPRNRSQVDGQQGRYLVWETLETAKQIIKDVNDDYSKRFGRRYGNGLIEKYRCEGAKAVLISMGSISGTAKDVIDEMRDKGEQIGLVRIRSFRPFPTEDIIETTKNLKALGIIDRNNPYGAVGGGILFHEVAASLYTLDKRPMIIGFHTGITRYTKDEQIRDIARKVLEASETGKAEKVVEWVWKKGEVIQ